jgi:hypothetical protein
MNFFRLFALGHAFDVDAYIKTSSLRFDHIWHRGDPKPGGIGRFANSGAQIDLGDGRKIPAEQQEAVAADFLDAHDRLLRELGVFPGVTHVTLGIHFCVHATPGLSSFTVGPSARLMQSALRAAVSPVFYVDLLREDALDQPGAEQ